MNAIDLISHIDRCIDALAKERSEILSMNFHVATYAAILGVSISELIGKSRKASLQDMRSILVHWLHTMHNVSIDHLAIILKRDSLSIMNLLERHHDYRKHDRRYQLDFQKFKNAATKIPRNTSK